MAYSVKSKKSGKMYYLHSKDVILKGNRKQTIYYFAGEEKEGVMNALPANRLPTALNVVALTLLPVTLPVVLIEPVLEMLALPTSRFPLVKTNCVPSLTAIVTAALP